MWSDERWKSARLCGAKHISKSKSTKHTSVGPLLEVEMSKKCTPLWREAHENTPGSEHFWKLRCRKNARRCGAKHISKSKVQKTVVLVALFEVQMSFLRGRHKGFCTLPKVSKPRGFCCIFNYNHHYTTLRSNTLRYNYNILQLYTYTTFLYATLHYNYTTLHSTMLHSTLYGQLGAPWRADNVAVGFFTFFCRVLVGTVQGVSLVSWSSGDPFFAARTKGSLRCSVSIQAAHGARIPSTKSRPFSISQEHPERRRAGSGVGPQKICMSIIAEWWGQPLDVWQSAGFHQSGRAPCRNKHCSSRYHRQNMSVLKLNQGYEGFCEPCFVSAVQCNLRRCQ